MGTAIFEILADPKRRQIVEILHDGESAVGDLVDAIQLAQPGVSRHLRILSAANMVQCKKDGQRRIYSLNPQAFHELEEWVQRYAFQQANRLDRLADLVQRKENS